MAIFDKRPPAIVLSMVVGGLFIVSGWFHLTNMIAFYESIKNYQMVSESIAKYLAAVFPPMMFALGVLLVVRRNDKGLLVLAGILLGLFAAAQWRVVMKGLQISCGCFGPISSSVTWYSAGWVTLLSVGCLGMALKPGLRFLQKKKAESSAAKENVGQAIQGGFSLIELLVVMAVISILIGMMLPAVQSIRESARGTACLNNLRQLGLSATLFESTFQRFPPGSLAVSPGLAFPTEVTIEDWFSVPTHPHHWKRTQHTSSLSLMLPFFDLQSLADHFPIQAFNPMTPSTWPGAETAVTLATQQSIPMLNCPSDDLSEDRSAIGFVAVQPCVVDMEHGAVQDAFLNQRDTYAETVRPRGTNYLGCTGVDSCAEMLGGVRKKYSGLMSVSRQNKAASVNDGLSNTILYGETLGMIEDGVRTSFQGWAFGAIGRGRGAAHWGNILDSETPTYFLGDSRYASSHGFGSRHPLSVNVVMGDGSTHAKYRGIDLYVWYALCGKSDGK